MTTILPRSFYARSALEVAPDLLGKTLVREADGQRLAGCIVEVEAYLGREDAASHAYRGPTPRSQVMFGPSGVAYVYFIYGMHHCLNVVTGDAGAGEAVLIRALQPLVGLSTMQDRRGQQDGRDLANGPGKLCQALGVDKAFDGHDLTLGISLWIEAPDKPVGEVSVSPRVGVRGDAQALAAPWRFYLRQNPHVSRSPLNRQGQTWSP